MFKNTIFIIPARRNSKGVPFKNRKLMSYTFDIIPSDYKKRIIVTSDDEEILKEAQKRRFKILSRPSKLAEDTTSTKEVLRHTINAYNIHNKNIICLYLTYPERRWEDIINAYNFFEKNSGKSLLCQKKPKTSPYLMMYKRNDIFGEQIIKHDLYRRQDYPDVFEISHFISIFKASEINYLNNNLYNEQTLFFPIEDKIDVDESKDLKKLEEKTKKIEEEKIDKETNHFLIIGNDKSLNDLNPENIPEKYITVGINRSWLKLYTDYLFFNDIDILKELIYHKINLEKMHLLSSDWLCRKDLSKENLEFIESYKKYIDIYKRKDLGAFPDSVTTAIKTLNDHIFEGEKNHFYIYGVSLRYDNEKNHFWSDNINEFFILNNKDKNAEWYNKRFAIIKSVLQKMKRQGYNITSVTKNSILNTIFPYKNLNLND